MSKESRQTIIKAAKRIFADSGYDGLSMRRLEQESGIGLSSIYHFFADKDVLLKAIFDETNTELGVLRAKLPQRKTANAMLKDRIKFQFDNIESVVFVLKYFLHNRHDFEHLHRGFVPAKAYLHIEEVITAGIKEGVFPISEQDIAKEAKVVTHAINGFLLEYYPDTPRGRELTEVTNSLHDFILRALTSKKEVPV